MNKKHIFIQFLLINFAISLNIECNYEIFDSPYAHGVNYRCLVKNEIDIDLPEEVYIENIAGTHMSGKSSDDDIHFHISQKPIEYFPRGMEKFYKNLKGIFIWFTQLKEIHQVDLKPYRNLISLYLSRNDIEVIEYGLFDYNLDLEVVIFENMKIFHIEPTVFKDLDKLVTLYFYENKCTKLHSVKDRAMTLKVIKGVKSTCNSQEFLNLKKKLENLEKMSKISTIVNSQKFSESVINFQTEFEDSKFASFSPLKEKYQKFIESLTKSYSEESYNGAANGMKVRNEQDSQQNILSAVDSKIEDLESRLIRKIEDLDGKLEKVMNNLKQILAML